MSSKADAEVHVPTVLETLKRVYMRSLRPLEEAYHFGEFHSPLLTEADFDAKPMVLLLGQYSVGKTSFIEYLMGRAFPGMRIGPEPTTDRFVIVMEGEEERVIPGNALAVHRDLPFTSLQGFGTGFLSRLEASQCEAPLLHDVTLIDTPGVLSGEKQRIGRQYDFVRVVEWFAQRSDLILLLFDAHKLDISDEFKSVIEALRGQDDKIRVVLNKADKVSAQQLMRVYGAMMWSLGKVVKAPEVMRVYIGSFWDSPCTNRDFEAMFRAEQSDLLRDLRSLPRNACVRKINELVKRARLARVHALIVTHLRQQMPLMFGKQKKQEQLIQDMANQFFEVMKQHRIPRGDFPPLARFKEIASTFNFSNFRKLDERMLQELQDVLSQQIPRLLEQLGHEQLAERSRRGESTELTIAEGVIRERPATEAGAGAGGSGHYDEAAGAAGGGGGAAGSGSSAPPAPTSAPASGGESGGQTPSASNPFATTGTADSWFRRVKKEERDAVFMTLPGARESGKVPGGACRSVMVESGLPGDALAQIWELADVDKDGYLDDFEFALAMHLINMAKNGESLPNSLPTSLQPPKGGGM